MRNLSKEDKLQFIKLCLKNPDIHDLNDKWLHNIYREEHEVMSKINTALFNLFKVKSFQYSTTLSYFMDNKSDKLIECYTARCKHRGN